MWLDELLEVTNPDRKSQIILMKKALDLFPDCKEAEAKLLDYQQRENSDAAEGSRHETLLQSATQSWEKLDHPDKRLLCVVKYTNVLDFDYLHQTADVPKQYIQGRIEKMIDWDVLSNEGNQLQINDGLSELIESYFFQHNLFPSLQVGASELVQSVFLSRKERCLYRLLSKVFSAYGCPVFPNMALETVFGENLKKLLSPDEFKFLVHSRVDCGVYSHEADRVVIAFEFDGPEHDKIDQIERDKLKDRIFAIAKLPLIRINYKEELTEGLIRTKIINTAFSLPAATRI
jgi:hypothetical protein